MQGKIILDTLLEICTQQREQPERQGEREGIDRKCALCLSKAYRGRGNSTSHAYLTAESLEGTSETS